MDTAENKKELVKKLFPNSLPTPEEIAKKYPARQLPAEAMVTRIGPSPTGFMHIGTLYVGLICERLARQTNGVFYLRIEDTDKKREIPGAVELIVQSLDAYDTKPDEGETADGTEKGMYGPYTQSKRVTIYQAFIKQLVEKGLAYPCFCTPEELEEMRHRQEALGIRPGYYSKWAKWRNKSDQEVLQALSEGKHFVIRFKSPGNFEHKITAHDLLLGTRELSENDQDIVIMKSDGLPTYHMAHVIDDHFMGTTHVIRGNEWFPSLPLHLQLFNAMGWQAPHYGHIFPLQKLDGSSKRKLSKRDDPEASITFYDEQGYPKDAVIEYLLNLANSSFEDWRKAHPDKNSREFILTFEKLAHSSGPLFDFVKLDDISKNIIANYSAERVYDEALRWAKKYDQELFNLTLDNSEYTKKILNIERGSQTKVRKDIGKWADIKPEVWYFFDQNFHLTQDQALNLLSDIKPDDIRAIVREFIKSYNEHDDNQEWFNKLKHIASEHGFAENTKEFKKNPEKYKGTITDVAKIFRVLLTGRVQTPDLHAIMQVMGKERVFKRLQIA